VSKLPSEVTITKLPMPDKGFNLVRTAIYARVSTHEHAQEESLYAQIDKYLKMIYLKRDWMLVGIYEDIASGKNISGRPGFQSLIEDCINGKIDMILAKSISRFGRNTVDVLQNVQTLRNHNVDAYFEVDNIRISDTHCDVMLSLISAVAQEESMSRSNNIKMGIMYRVKNGSSLLYTRPCYGYYRSAVGVLTIDEAQAINVRTVFNLYLQGHSVLSIIKQLKRYGIKSPSGNESWSKRAIENLLANEKYIGDVIVSKSYSHEFLNNKRIVNTGERMRYQAQGAHVPIIERETFEMVQEERMRRSNMCTVNGITARKYTHYSIKGVV
jgi:DNA invertase Pin-like site-specific DNA recombinase